MKMLLKLFACVLIATTFSAVLASCASSFDEGIGTGALFPNNIGTGGIGNETLSGESVSAESKKTAKSL